MANVATLNGHQLLIQIGDGGGPEVFTHDCLINTERGIQFSADGQETIIPDCADPDAPAWKDLMKDGLMAVVNGQGLLNTSSLPAWDTWFRNNATKNVRVNVNVAGASGGGYWAGAFHLMNFEVTGTRKQKATVSVTLQSSGTVTRTANA